jgi:NAD(P)-dependent dehydrogenase (short-subunit alcohol dehydrogenase family)
VTGILDGRTALVTGSSRGIGRATALELAQHGADIGLNYVHDKASAESAASEIASMGRKVVVVQADISDPNKASYLVEEVHQKLGGLDILVNNAGIARDRSVRNMSTDEWQDVIDTDLSGVFYCTRSALQLMTQTGGGHIVCVSSVVAQTGNYGQANYAAAKAGVIAFAKSVALEVAQFDIRVNVVAPGFVLTDMAEGLPDEVKINVLDRIPLTRYGLPENIASMIRFLVTEGEFITGAVFNVNGGMYM